MEGVVLNLGEVIIGSLIFITTTLWGIFQYFQSQRHSIQVEKLKYSLEIQRNQGILNDEKYRLAYEDFINVFVSMLKDIKLNETAEKKKKKFEGYVERMYNFIETSLLFSGPETIKSFGKYKKFSNSKEKNDTTKVLSIMGDLILSMRKDLGVDNGTLSSNNILQTIANFDINELSN